MSKKTRIAIIGDSTIGLIRPYRDHKNNFTYSELLIKNNNFIVDIYMKPGMVSHDALILTWQELMGNFYDVCIFNFGINDCVPRSYPKYMANFYNKTLIPQTKVDKFYLLLYRIFSAKKIQAICSKIGISRPWANLKTFDANVKKIIEILSKETDAKILFLTIPKTSKRVENTFQNINKLIPQYSQIIKNNTSSNVGIVDIDSLFEKDYNKYISEGIHYSFTWP
jgi:hypothetical protein